MKYQITFCLFILLSISLTAFPQDTNKDRTVPLKAEESLEFIAGDLQEIAISLKELKKDVVKAYDTLSKNMGLSLTDNQQKILVSFEILNRAELRLANLQKLRIDLIEKQTNISSEVAVVREKLRDEQINRSISLYGTTNAEALREKRRTSLRSKETRLSNLLSEINTTLLQTNGELRETAELVYTIRRTLFPAIYRELPKLDYEN